MLAPPLDQLVPIAVLLSFSLTLIRRRRLTEEESHMSEVPDVRLTPEAMVSVDAGVADWRAEFTCARCGTARARDRGGRLMARAKPLVPGRTEAQVLAQVIEAAAMLGLDPERENTGAGVNPKGQMVRFGRPGRPDISLVLPDGRACKVEIKREGFDPRRLRGAKREHFDRQLAEMRRVNASNGVAFWVSDAGDFLAAMQRILAGCRVEIDAEGFPWVTDEPPTGGG